MTKPAIKKRPKTLAAVARTFRLRGPRPGPAEPRIGHNSEQEAEVKNLPAVLDNKHLTVHCPAAFAELRDFVANFPTIENEEDHKKGTGFLERTRIALTSLEEEEKRHTGPLRTRLDAIYETYRNVRKPIADTLSVLRNRLSTYVRAEEARRKAEAEQARQEAEAAAEAARLAAEAANNAVAEADVGVESDAGGAIAEAHAAFRVAAKADRAAARAERAVPVRASSMLGRRAISARGYEVLTISDPCAAIEAMGMPPVLQEAFETAAREYRKAHGELPPGITSHTERRV